MKKVENIILTKQLCFLNLFLIIIYQIIFLNQQIMSGYPYKNTKPRYVEKKQQNQTLQNQIQKNELPQQSKNNQYHHQQNRNRNKQRKPRYNEKREDDQHSENQDHKRGDYRQHKNYHQKKRFDRNEDKIKFFTQIESLPQVRKIKPNQENFKQKIGELQDKIAKNKQLRKQEKENLKKAQEQFKQRQKQIQKKINLGENAKRLYQNQQIQINDQINYINNGIHQIENKIKNIGKNQQKKKKPEQMTYEQLDNQLRKLEHKLISSNLTKQQINEINLQRTNYNRLKINAPHSTKTNLLSDEQFLEKQKKKLYEKKQLRKKKKIQLLQIQAKLQAIDSDLAKFDNELDQLKKDEQAFKNGPQYEKSKQYKEQIRKLRAELKQVDIQYYNLLDEYNLEQQLIEYIGWANQVKKIKIQQHELQKQERRKQRQKQRRRQEKKGDKDQKNKKGEQNKQSQRERLPPPHPFSKQILDLRFLIQYCNNLKPQQQKQEVNSQIVKTKEQIEKQIQKGQWAKQKGIAIVKSKKDNDLEFSINTSKGKKKLNNVQPVLKQQVEKPTQFNHIIQIVRLFDTFKILPPTKIEELEPVLKQLQQKKAYFSALTSEQVSKQNYQRKYDRRNPEQKATTKGVNPTKKANISIVDFPDLV